MFAKISMAFEMLRIITAHYEDFRPTFVAIVVKTETKQDDKWLAKIDKFFQFVDLVD